MLKSRVFKVGNFRLADFLGRNNILLFLTGILVIGILSGCLVFGNLDAVNDLAENWFDAFINCRNKSGFLNIFLSVFWSLVPFHLICFFCGTSVVGSVVTPCVVAVKGFFIGLLSSFVFVQYGLLGVAFNGLIIIPAGTVSAVSFLLCAKEAMRFSAMLFSFSLPSSNSGHFYTDFKNYLVKNLLFLALLILSALLDTAVSSAALKLFEL